MTAENMFVEFLVKIRDAAAEALDKMTPEGVKEPYYNPENLKWIRASGPSGIYERFPAPQQKPKPTADYINLVNDLKAHDGKLTHAGLFYWLFSDNETIGRKPSH